MDNKIMDACGYLGDVLAGRLEKTNEELRKLAASPLFPTARELRSLADMREEADKLRHAWIVVGSHAYTGASAQDAWKELNGCLAAMPEVEEEVRRRLA